MPSASIHVDTSSLRSLLTLMEDIDKKVKTKGLRSALRAGRKLFLEEAKSRVPTKYKLLKKSLSGREKVKGAKGFAYAVLGPKRRAGEIIDGKERLPTKYAHLVEYGTAPHDNGRKDGRTHPGSRPQPFLRPAWDASRDRILAEMKKILMATIEEGRA